MITCFLIDDDPDDHDFFKLAVAKIHPAIHTHVAINGRLGLDAIDDLSPRPDVIFLDLNMPVLGGLEFLQEIKNTVFGQIPVIVYSTSDEQFFKDRSFELGAVAYFIKPSSMSALTLGIKTHLKQLSLI